MAKTKAPIHNNFFLQQFSNLQTARSFFEEYLPVNVKESMDWSIMHLAPRDFVQKALRNRRSDLLYETRFSGFKGYFYLHLEHQRRPHPDMPFRLLVYMVNIWEQHKKQYPKEPIPLIFPMVLYQGATSWKVSLSFHEFLEVPHALKPYVPNFTYSLMDLSKLSDEEIKGQLLLRVALLLMKHIDAPDLKEYLIETILPLLNEFTQKETGLETLETVLYYLFQGNPHLEKASVIPQIQEQFVSEKAQEVIMTIAEQLRQEGLQQGVQQGVQQEALQLVVKLLEKKFSPLTGSHQRILEGLPVSELESLAERILDASGLEEVFDGFPKRSS